MISICPHVTNCRIYHESIAFRIYLTFDLLIIKKYTLPTAETVQQHRPSTLERGKPQHTANTYGSRTVATVSRPLAEDIDNAREPTARNPPTTYGNQ